MAVSRAESIYSYVPFPSGALPKINTYMRCILNRSKGLKTFMNYVTMTITYPFDPSINHTHMSNFQHRIRSSPSPFPSGQKLTLPKERWELEALYIAPQYQRNGYGMEALNWGIETAKKEGVEVWV